MVRDTFLRVQEINTAYTNIEITVNFIIDETLSEKHYSTMLDLVCHMQNKVKPKGTIYLSPLSFDQPSRSKLFAFNRLKMKSRLPTFLYIIQRI